MVGGVRPCDRGPLKLRIRQIRLGSGGPSQARLGSGGPSQARQIRADSTRVRGPPIKARPAGGGGGGDDSGNCGGNRTQQ